jgi:Histidine kinase-, DNA gyrase B-, and HSP90-like ATPase
MGRQKRKQKMDTGKLRIGDDWNAISIIALSQSNPLKALAEFVENSIDAGAKNIVITRGKEKREPYITVNDDGAGIPKDEHGVPDFHYVATHICDSIKKQIKKDGDQSLQGEFGIGLLSFWTLGEELTLTCSAQDGQTYQMSMRKGDTDYSVVPRRVMFPEQGTELKIKPLLSGMRQLSGEKIQWYLASELRDRIRKNAVNLRVIDRTARKEFKVEPREFSGQLIHRLPPAQTSDGDIYVELYLAEPGSERKVGLYRNGTRVLADIAEFDGLKSNVWSAGYLEGIVDIPFLNLTPGTRTGVIRDEQFARAWFALRPIEDHLENLIQELQKAEEERASKQVLKSIQKAFREALLTLPAEEYDWFDISASSELSKKKPSGETDDNEAVSLEDETTGSSPVNPESASNRQGEEQKDFFEYAGPLFSVTISPASSVIHVGESRTLRGITRDRRGRTVDHELQFSWQVAEGAAKLENADGEIVTVIAGLEPGLAKIRLTASQHEIRCENEALITITDSLEPVVQSGNSHQSGLPGYTYLYAAGELWRSRYDEEQNVIVINNGHRDFVYASKTRVLKLRYIARLFAKELVLKNFPGLPSDRLLERMIELSLYTEENLK